MKAMRHTLGALLAIALVAFALPASAADKLFKLTVSTFDGSGNSTAGVIPAGVTSIVLLDIHNQSPTGANSVIKSLQVAVPSDVKWTIMGAGTFNGGGCPAAPSNPPTPTSSGTITLGGLTGVKPSGDYCIYLAVTSSSCSIGVWAGQANTGTNFGGGQPFSSSDDPTKQVSSAQTADGCLGTLGCDNGTTSGNNVVGNLGSTVFTDSAFVGSPDWGLVRGNNGTCTPAQYGFILDSVNNIANFTALKPSGQIVAVEYVVLWPATPIATSGTDSDGNPLVGWTEERPKVAWGFATQPPANYFTPALACLSEPATPADIPSTNMPVIPNVEPFATLSKPVALGGAGLTQYTPGSVAGMCIVQHGWTSKSGMIQYWDKVIDLSDSWIIH